MVLLRSIKFGTTTIFRNQNGSLRMDASRQFAATEFPSAGKVMATIFLGFESDIDELKKGQIINSAYYTALQDLKYQLSRKDSEWLKNSAVLNWINCDRKLSLKLRLLERNLSRTKKLLRQHASILTTSKPIFIKWVKWHFSTAGSSASISEGNVLKN